MKKILLWIGVVLVFLTLVISCLFLFYPDEKLANFDDLKIDLPKISENQNGYKYVVEAYDSFVMPEGVSETHIQASDSQAFNDFFESGKFGDIKNLPDFYLLLKANTKVFEAIDKANEFEYLLPNIGLDDSIHEHFQDVNRLLLFRVLYQLQQGNQDEALDNLIELMQFQNKNIFVSRPLILHFVKQDFFDSSLYLLRLILADVNLSVDDYVELFHFLNRFEPNLLNGRNSSLKLEFYLMIERMESILVETNGFLSRSRFHFQKNKTQNGFAGYFIKMINDPFYSPDQDMSVIGQKYGDSSFMRLLNANSLGEMLMGRFVPTSGGCSSVSAIFDLNSLRLLVAMKLYEIENTRAPESLEDLVPHYYKNLNWLNFRNERIIDYDFKARALYSNLLQKKCKIYKNVALVNF